MKQLRMIFPLNITPDISLTGQKGKQMEVQEKQSCLHLPLMSSNFLPDRENEVCWEEEKKTCVSST